MSARGLLRSGLPLPKTRWINERRTCSSLARHSRFVIFFPLLRLMTEFIQLNKPIPDDLVPILAKDEDKQRVIKEKSQEDAHSSNARAIGPSITTAGSGKKMTIGEGKGSPPPSQTLPQQQQPAAKGKKDAPTSKEKEATPVAAPVKKSTIRMNLQP